MTCKILPLVLAVALTACTAGGTGPVKAPAANLGGTTGIVTNTSANIVTNTSANLTVSGTVRVPVGIVTNTSANIVTNTSANIVTNTSANIVTNASSNFGLLAVQEQVVANATVAILDAKGQPVMVNGKPLTTTTDAQGRYRISLPGTRINRQLAVDLGGGNRLSAITARRAQVDLDLASTLASTYILNRYVSQQPDPDGVLDRLEADAADLTRAQVLAALDGASADAPASLAEVALVTAMAKLRARSHALDEALTKVHQLLLAGLSNLGEGQDARMLSLSRIGGLALGEGDSLAINCAWAHRVWQLTADNRLHTIAGTGAPVEAASVQGADARNTAFGFLAGLARDGRGRSLLLEDNRLNRVDADGRVTELVPRAAWPADAGAGLGVFVRGEEVRVLTENAFYALGADGVLAVVRRFTKDEQAKLRFSAVTALAPDGSLWVGRTERTDTDPAAHRIYKLDGAVTLMAGNGVNSPIAALSLDPNGVIFKVEADRRLTALLPDGTSHRMAVALPAGLRFDPYVMVGFVNPELAYVATRDGDVYRLAKGEVQHVVGTPPTLPPAVAGPSALALDAPSGLVETSAGDLIIAETHAHRVTRLSASGKVTLVAGTGEPGYAEPGQAAGTMLYNPSVVGVDAAGTVYVLDNTYPNDAQGNFIRAINASGVLRTVHAFKRDTESVRDFAVAPDGGLFVSLSVSGASAAVKYYPPDGGPEQVIMADVPLTKPTTVPPHVFSTATRLTLALAADGKTLYVSGLGKLWRWSAAAGAELVKEDPIFLQLSRFKGLALDARGRVYLTHLDQIVRFDPATGAHEALAGEGGAHFSGGTVDDSLLEPTNPLVTQAGSLLVLDREHRQIKALPPAEL
ncbi:MAG: repeat containing protein [Cyanobacteria bacterium RYN_339]|nr:repeat containing protein [Cyanobacteria bacterium RYN_339]